MGKEGSPKKEKKDKKGETSPKKRRKGDTTSPRRGKEKKGKKEKKEKKVKAKWAMKWHEKKKCWMYILKKKDENGKIVKTTQRPEDFDGLDLKKQAEDMENEKVWAFEHERMIQAMQIAALDEAEKVSELEAGLDQARRELKRYQAKGLEWEGRLAEVADLSNRDGEKEENDQGIYDGDVEDLKEQEQALLLERAELHNKAKSEEQLTQECKQQVEANMQLGKERRKEHREAEKVTSELDATLTALERATKQSETMRAVIQNAKDEKARLKAEYERLESERANQDAERRCYHSKVTEGKELLSTTHLQMEHRAEKEEGLTRDIAKLKHQILVMQHNDLDDIPPAATSRAWRERLQADRSEWVSDVADVSADIVDMKERVSALRSEFVDQSIANQAVCDENLRLLQQAAPLPLKMGGILTRHAERLRKNAARLQARQSATHRELDAIEGQLHADIHEVLKTPPSLSQESVPTLCGRLRQLQKLQKQVEGRLYTTMKKADVCSMEHDHVEQLMAVRMEERARQAEFARSVVEHVDGKLQALQEQDGREMQSAAAVMCLESSSMLGWTLWGADDGGVAKKYSEGLLVETRANMLAAEAYIMKKRKWEKRRAAGKRKHHNLMLKILEGAEGAVSVKAMATQAGGSAAAHAFGRAAREFQQEQDYECHRVHAAGDEHQRLPAGLLGMPPHHPNRVASQFRTTSAPYNIHASRAWKEYTSDKAGWE